MRSSHRDEHRPAQRISFLFLKQRPVWRSVHANFSDGFVPSSLSPLPSHHPNLYSTPPICTANSPTIICCNLQPNTPVLWFEFCQISVCSFLQILFFFGFFFPFLLWFFLTCLLFNPLTLLHPKFPLLDPLPSSTLLPPLPSPPPPPPPPV